MPSGSYEEVSQGARTIVAKLQERSKEMKKCDVDLQVIYARELYNRALVEKNTAMLERAKALWSNCNRWRKRNSLTAWVAQQMFVASLQRRTDGNYYKS